MTTNRNQLQGYNGIGWRDVRVDRSTDTFQTIDYVHHEIHAGSHFRISGFDVISSASTVAFTFTTPDTTTWAHLVFSFESSADVEFSMYRSVGYQAGTGSTQTALNSNENNSTTSLMVIVKDPTITTTGTLIDSYRGGTNGPFTSRGGTPREKELILKQDTTYLFIFTSHAASNIVSYIGEWYEHEDKA